MNNNSSSSSAQNWLGFSLSNNHSQPSHLSLFQDHHHHATDLSIFTGAAAPKLEDFLGGDSSTSTTTTTPPPNPPFHFSTLQSPPTFCDDTSSICDSDLKTIAASFLRETRPQIPPRLPPSDQLAPPKKAVDTFGQRTSIYRGVTRHRWTGRYEAHLWDNSCRREGQSRKGRQVYLGGYDKEEKAARAYDLAALKYWGPTTTTNFPVMDYERELEDMKNMTRQEFVASLRRKSSGFSRGASIYRGVTRHHQHGRWQARIGRVAGNKDLYLGTFSTQEEAAEAYDIAAIKFRGLNAVTNFDISRYDVKSIASSNLPIGGMSGSKSKNSPDSTSESKSIDGGSRSTEDRDNHHSPASSTTTTFMSQPAHNPPTLNFAIPIKQDPSDQYWSIFGYHPNNTNFNHLQQSPNSSGTMMFQANPTIPTFALDLPSVSSSLNEQQNDSSSLYNGVYVNEQACVEIENADSNSIQYQPTIGGLSSGISIEIGQSMRGFQTHVKPSYFQTPIFGME